MYLVFTTTGVSPASSNICRFGISSLDEILGGGIQRGSVFVLEDSIGAESDPFIIQFLVNGLSSMDYVYIVNTDMPYEYYEKTFSNMGLNPVMQMQTQRLKFIDAFSTLVGYQSKAQEFTEPITDLSNGREVNESIRRGMLHVRGQNVAVRGATISLSSIIQSADTQKHIFSFIRQRLAMDRYEGWTTIFSLHADAHDPTLVRAIEHLVDGILRLRRVRGKNNESLQEIEVINIRSRPELTGKKARFKIDRGKIQPVYET